MYNVMQTPSIKKDAEFAAFRTYHLLVHMADFEDIELNDLGKYIIMLLKLICSIVVTWHERFA